MPLPIGIAPLQSHINRTGEQVIVDFLKARWKFLMPLNKEAGKGLLLSIV
jgi:hypothetical protein